MGASDRGAINRVGIWPDTTCTSEGNICTVQHHAPGYFLRQLKYFTTGGQAETARHNKLKDECCESLPMQKANTKAYQQMALKTLLPVAKCDPLKCNFTLLCFDLKSLIVPSTEHDDRCRVYRPISSFTDDCLTQTRISLRRTSYTCHGSYTHFTTVYWDFSRSKNNKFSALQN